MSGCVSTIPVIGLAKVRKREVGKRRVFSNQKWLGGLHCREIESHGLSTLHELACAIIGVLVWLALDRVARRVGEHELGDAGFMLASWARAKLFFGSRVSCLVASASDAPELYLYARRTQRFCTNWCTAVSSCGAG